MSRKAVHQVDVSTSTAEDELTILSDTGFGFNNVCVTSYPLNAAEATTSGSDGEATTPLSPLSSQRELHQLTDELQNMQQHIALTKEHLDKLNARFAGYQSPPPMFLSVRDLNVVKLSFLRSIYYFF